MYNKHTIAATIDYDDADKLKFIASMNRTSQSAIIRKLISEYVNVEYEKLREKLRNNDFSSLLGSDNFSERLKKHITF